MTAAAYAAAALASQLGQLRAIQSASFGGGGGGGASGVTAPSSGGGGSNAAGGVGSNKILRADFDKLSPAEKNKMLADGIRPVNSI